jgi:hypothetical protein
VFNNSPFIAPAVKRKGLNDSLFKSTIFESQDYQIIKVDIEPKKNGKDSKYISENVYTNYREKSDLNFFIDWESVIEILIFIDETNRINGHFYQNFKYAYEKIWKPIFNGFIQADLLHTRSYAMNNEMKLEDFCDISSLDLEKYKTNQMNFIFNNTNLKSLSKTSTSILEFDIKNYMIKTDSCLQQFYKNNICQKCTIKSDKCKKREKIYLCAFCNFYFCSDCINDALGKEIYFF